MDYCMEAPMIIEEEWLKEQYAKKRIIPVEKLIDGEFYVGHCRNSSLAVWNKEKKCFIYLRHKFGSAFLEEIDCIESETVYDMFLPHYIAGEYQKEKIDLLKKYLNADNIGSLAQ